jgi:hypothetical protein
MTNQWKGNNWWLKLDKYGWKRLMETRMNSSRTQEELNKLHGTQGSFITDAPNKGNKGMLPTK